MKSFILRHDSDIIIKAGLTPADIRHVMEEGGGSCMGRGKKKVLTDTLDRRETGYYSTPAFIGDYIARRLLELNPSGQEVLDPCCGKGELLPLFLQENKKVTGIDLEKQDGTPPFHFLKGDFIRIYKEWRAHNLLPLGYDYIIANPPYNCHEVNYIRDRKKELEKLFEDVGTHNMYSMFLSAILDCAKPGTVIGLITSDSFFTARYHEKLRRKILKLCAIHEIIMCPTDLFLEQGADVRTSILILQKGPEYQGQVAVSNRCSSVPELKDILAKRDFTSCPLQQMLLHGPKDHMEFAIECPEDIRKLFENKRLGEYHKCVTGISTGNDGKYLSPVRTGPFQVPFYKNPGLDRFCTDNYLYLHKDFLQYANQISNFMVRNREQLYREGITCSSMGVAFTACYLPSGSTYGVNANIHCEGMDLWRLLAYLNSSLVTYLVRGILARSNMITSGYVARIPLLSFSPDESIRLDALAKEAYRLAKNNGDVSALLSSIDTIVFHTAGISQASIQHILEFNRDLIRNT
jgi:hypothetical protein